MSLIPWIDKADDQILTDKARRDDKAGAYYPIITHYYPDKVHNVLSYFSMFWKG